MTDREEYFLMNVDRGKWTEELRFYLVCMVTATFAGAVAVGVLSLNLRPVHEHDWRARSCRSIFALVLIDFLAIDTLYFVVEVICTHKVTTGFSQMRGENDMCVERSGVCTSNDICDIPWSRIHNLVQRPLRSDVWMLHLLPMRRKCE